MKTNRTPEDDGALRQVLREWTVDTPLPPRFQEQVWRRIARAETQAESTVWARLLHLVEVVLPRPKVAVSYVTILLASGVAVGSWAAQVKSRRLDADLSLRYVQSVAPYRADTRQP